MLQLLGRRLHRRGHGPCRHGCHWAALATMTVAWERPRLKPRARKIPRGREWPPTPAFLPGGLHGQRSLAGYSPWGCKESHTTEWLSFSFSPPPPPSPASLVAQLVKSPPAILETWVRSLGWEDPLEEGTATHSSILASRTIQSMGSQRVRHDWATCTSHHHLHPHHHLYRNYHHR